MNLLLCEDDSSVGNLIQRGLSRAGFNVDWVQQGRDALGLAMQRPYQSVILDLGLPDCDGLSVCRELRDANKQMPVLVLTARDSLEQKLDGFRAGADDYLTKPFAFEELIMRIKALSRRAGAGRADGGDALEVGDIRLDRLAKEVYCNHQIVTLTDREFHLLECLLEQAGKVVTRERIIRRVWGCDAEVSDNAVDVYVGYLRKKLDDRCPNRRIRTVRGVGFKFEANEAEVARPVS